MHRREDASPSDIVKPSASDQCTRSRQSEKNTTVLRILISRPILGTLLEPQLERLRSALTFAPNAS